MKKDKIFKLIIGILFITYIICFIISESGYYEYKMKERTILSNEQIKKFEEDVKNNINVDINDYTIPEYIDYTNKFTKGVNSTSNLIKKYFKKIVEGGFKILNSLVSG